MQVESGYTEGKANFKAGKLIRISARFKDDKIEDIKITGDFYIYPENSIEILEEKLRGEKMENVEKIINDILKDAECIGIDAKSLTMAVKKAWMNRR